MDRGLFPWFLWASAMLLGGVPASRAQPFFPFQTNRPALQIGASNGNVTVSWPLSPFEYELQGSSLAGGWSAVTNAQGGNIDNALVTLPASTDRNFYRLRGFPFAPLFHFGVFYAVDLEIGLLPVFTVKGPVHGNANIYADPHTSLTFAQRVTSAQSIIEDRAPGDTLVRSNGPVIFLAGRRAGVAPLHLAGGTNAWRQIVEIPPAGENPLSPMGVERFYNKADLIVVVSNSGMHATSGRYDNFSTVIPASALPFVTTNASFYNGREAKNARCVDVDIGKLRQWNATNTILQPPSGAIRILYVADLRTHASSAQGGVRLLNGFTNLPQGLTVATPNPLYVKGHYNCPNAAHLGTTNTTATMPCALIADAITILSSAWSDATSTLPLNSRVAVSTTVNAALVSGIVQTATNSGYSGGLENFPRLLEDWSNRTLTFNGSMAALFTSQVATGRWNNIGIYYNPPVRNWSFDTNFKEVTKLPPGTPAVGVLAE